MKLLDDALILPKAAGCAERARRCRRTGTSDEGHGGSCKSSAVHHRTPCVKAIVLLPPHYLASMQPRPSLSVRQVAYSALPAAPNVTAFHSAYPTQASQLCRSPHPLFQHTHTPKTFIKGQPSSQQASPDIYMTKQYLLFAATQCLPATHMAEAPGCHLHKSTEEVFPAHCCLTEVLGLTLGNGAGHSCARGRAGFYIMLVHSGISGWENGSSPPPTAGEPPGNQLKCQTNPTKAHRKPERWF